jgi:hypothetical protein
MKVLAVCRPTSRMGSGDLLAHLAEEAKMLENWRDAGMLLEAYSPGGPGAVLIFDLVDIQQAQALVENLPLCEAGLVEAELIGLHPLEILRKRA